MMQKLVGTITFSPELRDRWPTRVLTAEAHLGSESKDDAGPWSLRAELWAPPDEQGKALAWVYFLSPEAPITQELAGDIELTLGKTLVATCQVRVMNLSDGIRLAVEQDFLETPGEAVRAA